MKILITDLPAGSLERTAPMKNTERGIVTVGKRRVGVEIVGDSIALYPERDADHKLVLSQVGIKAEVSEDGVVTYSS